MTMTSLRYDDVNVGDELHHFGWNACSSALKHEGHNMDGLARRYGTPLPEHVSARYAEYHQAAAAVARRSIAVPSSSASPASVTSRTDSPAVFLPC